MVHYQKLQHFEAVIVQFDCDFVYLQSLCKTIMTSFDFGLVPLEFRGKTPLSGCETSGVNF